MNVTVTLDWRYLFEGPRDIYSHLFIEEFWAVPQVWAVDSKTRVFYQAPEPMVLRGVDLVGPSELRPKLNAFGSVVLPSRETYVDGCSTFHFPVGRVWWPGSLQLEITFRELGKGVLQ